MLSGPGGATSRGRVVSDQPTLTIADHAILRFGACPLCTDDRVQIWHTGTCPQLEDEDEG